MPLFVYGFDCIHKSSIHVFTSIYILDQVNFVTVEVSIYILDNWIHLIEIRIMITMYN